MALALRSNSTSKVLYLAALFLAVAQVPAFAADLSRGADLFETHCSDCHSVSAKLANRKGPSLYTVVGRKAGTIPGAKYSPAMLQSGLIWDAKNLDTYLTNPKGPVPTGTMKFKGLPKSEDRADLIAYLASLR